MLTISQWQRWNLFAPDPLRRVIEMEFDQKIDGNWTHIFTLNSDTVSWLQRAPELKIMRRMDEDRMEPLQERYVHDFCRIHGIPSGTDMRLRRRWHVIPRNPTTRDTAWWNAWEPEWKSQVLIETSCPFTEL